jgi:hypothetical protein
MTISAIHALLRRRAELDQPVRIIYLADFDDAGQFMALGPARHIEFAIRNMDPRPDIRLHHLALTAEQVITENIPRKIPKTKTEEEKQQEEREQRRDGRKKNFEARHGAGTVQLNALTVNPARLRWFISLLREVIHSLRDPNIEEKLAEAEWEAEALLELEIEDKFRWVHRAYDLLREQARQTREEKRNEHSEERSALRQRQRELYHLLQLLQQREDELDEEVDEALEPFEERAERVRHVAQLRLAKLYQDIELPRVEPEEPEEATEG